MQGHNSLLLVSPLNLFIYERNVGVFYVIYNVMHDVIDDLISRF